MKLKSLHSFPRRFFRKLRKFVLWIPIVIFTVGSLVSVGVYQNLHRREQEALRNESTQRFQEMVNQLDLLFSNSILRIQSYEDYLGSKPKAYKEDTRFVSQSLGYTLFQRLSLIRYTHAVKPGTKNLPLMEVQLRIDSAESTLNPVTAKYVEGPEVLQAVQRLLDSNGQQQAVLHTYHEMPRVSFILRSKNDKDIFFVFTTPLTAVFAKLDLRPKESVVLTDAMTGYSWVIEMDGGQKKAIRKDQAQASIGDEDGSLYATGLPQSGLKLNFRFNFEPHQEALSPAVIAGFMSLVITLIIAYLFYVLVRQNSLVTRLVIEKTHDLEKAHHELQETLLGKSRFLGNISHEIRTPLNLILGMIDLCEEEDVDQKISHYLSSMRSSGNHLLSMIEDLLDLAKSESNDLQIQPKKFNFIQFLEELSRIAGQDSLKKGLRFYTQWSGDLPTGIVCDPSRLRQILVNLLRNAAKYTNEGHVLLRVSVVSRQADKAHLRFEVEDTGVGISEDKLSKIFDAFFQVEGSFALSEGGVGLGLAIVKELARKLGGTLQVRSRPKVGSTFQVDLEVELSEPTAWLEAFRSNDDKKRNLVLVSTNPFLAEALRPLDQHPVVSVEVVNPADFHQWWQQHNSNTENWLLIDSASQGFSIEMVRSLKRQDQVVLLGNKKDIVEARDRWNFPVLDNAPLILTEVLNLLGLSSRVRKKKETQAVSAPANAEIPALEQNYSFIVADDDIGNKELYMAYFEKTPWKIEFANNGQEALDAYLKEPADLLILDVRMPVMDGFEVVEKVRAYEEKQSLPEKPILLISADALGGTGEKALTYPRVSFLTKPIKKAVLFEEIQRVLHSDLK